MIVVSFDIRVRWLVLGFSACAAFAQPADLVLRNGKVITLEQGITEAQGLAARGGVIVAIGSSRAMDAVTGPSTRVIDLQGRLAIPGFIEGHGHLTSLGETETELDLRDAKNWDQIVAMVAAAAQKAKPGEWILGSGFQ